MNRTQAQAILDRFPGKRVLVVGDLMLDEHLWGSITRISPEAPVPVVDVHEQTFVPGGAANVARQLQSFDASVVVAGVVGEDESGARLRALLEGDNRGASAIVLAHDRPTTVKTRIVAAGHQAAQQIVRVDRERRAPLPADVADSLCRAIEAAMPDCDAVIFSDYTKGVLGRSLIERTIAAARRYPKIVVSANAKPPSARYYADADIVQLNRSEADLTAQTERVFESSNDLAFHDAGHRLRTALGVRNLLVTRSSDGLTVFQNDGSFTDILPHRVEVFDGTGAGDSTIAGVTLALACGASVADAVAIGNASGGVVVRRVGVVTASRSEVAELFAAEL